MDISFLKNILRDYPKFWEDYLQHFNDKNSTNRYVIFDLKTSSKNEKNKLLVLSAIGIENEAIYIDDFIEIFI